MYSDIKNFIKDELASIEERGLIKPERVISSAQQDWIILESGQRVMNLCANNYLGLSNHPVLIEAAKKGMDDFGYGLSSVRFICGTQDGHKTLENKLSKFLGMEDTILYSSCFDANAGLFETVLGPDDAIISDQLNHASIIDGVRLCKAKRFRYANSDMEDLETQLQSASEARFRLIATDGVFSMDGTIANLKGICDLADKYDALVMVDDSHAVGFLGDTGRGTHEYCDVMDRVDIITGTLGKALGGASGGYTSARKEIVELLRQRSRPYLFSNSLAPMIVSASIAGLELISTDASFRQKLWENTSLFRDALTENGFKVMSSDHPILPIMLFDARLAQQMADALLDEGIYVIGFSYPVVPDGKARIRVQISAAHNPDDLAKSAKLFSIVRDRYSS